MSESIFLDEQQHCFRLAVNKQLLVGEISTTCFDQLSSPNRINIDTLRLRILISIQASSRMAAQSSYLSQLAQSGDYSDFILLCQGEHFHLHRAIVCPQSSVIAATLEEELKVSTPLSLRVSHAVD